MLLWRSYGGVRVLAVRRKSEIPWKKQTASGTHWHQVMHNRNSSPKQSALWRSQSKRIEPVYVVGVLRWCSRDTSAPSEDYTTEQSLALLVGCRWQRKWVTPSKDKKRKWLQFMHENYQRLVIHYILAKAKSRYFKQSNWKTHVQDTCAENLSSNAGDTNGIWSISCVRKR